MKMLAILSSIPIESDQILASLHNVRKITIKEIPGYRGVIAGRSILVMNTGIGKVNAAISAVSVIIKYRVDKVVTIGIGGAYPGSGLSVGDIAIASKEIYGDEGVNDQRGWHSLRKIGIPLVQTGKKKYFNEFPLHIPARSFFTGINKVRNRKNKIKFGNFVTVSATSGTQKRARELEKRFSAISENMEGAAIAHVCALYKIPMLEIRGISNIAGIRDKRKWNLEGAAQNCQGVVLEMLKKIL